jgi:hypothetical protein
MSSREEFEAWWIDRQSNSEGIASPAKEKIAREAWEASRAALVVELPQQSGVNLDWNQAIRYCHQAIEAAGVRVKP